MSNTAFLHFGHSGRLDGPKRDKIYPKRYYMSKKDASQVQKLCFKKSQSGNKISLKWKYTISMLCDTCFVDNFSRTHRNRRWLDPKTSSNWTFDGGSIKVMPNEATFWNQYFCIIIYLFIYLLHKHQQAVPTNRCSQKIWRNQAKGRAKKRKMMEKHEAWIYKFGPPHG